MLKTNWLSSIAKAKENPLFSQLLRKPKDLIIIAIGELEKSEVDIARKISTQKETRFSQEEVTKFIEELKTESGLFSPFINKIKSEFQIRDNQVRILMDERKQDAWADMNERIRYLVFRVLTAAGIGAVVLLTYWLGNKWGIPLPAVRI